MTDQSTVILFNSSLSWSYFLSSYRAFDCSRNGDVSLKRWVKRLCPYIFSILRVRISNYIWLVLHNASGRLYSHANTCKKSFDTRMQILEINLVFTRWMTESFSLLIRILIIVLTLFRLEYLETSLGSTRQLKWFLQQESQLRQYNTEQWQQSVMELVSSFLSLAGWHFYYFSYQRWGWDDVNFGITNYAAFWEFQFYVSRTADPASAP